MNAYDFRMTSEETEILAGVIGGGLEDFLKPMLSGHLVSCLKHAPSTLVEVAQQCNSLIA